MKNLISILLCSVCISLIGFWDHHTSALSHQSTDTQNRESHKNLLDKHSEPTHSDAVQSANPPKPSRRKNPDNLPNSPGSGTPGGSQVPSGDRDPSKSKCVTAKNLQKPIAVMPNELKVVTESPDFWFYIPYKSESIDHLSFTILDEKNQEIQPKQKVDFVSEHPGFIKLHLPTTHPSLKIGKRYKWFFSINCDPENKEDRDSFNGIIERVNLDRDFLEKLESLNMVQKVAYFLKNNYRYDAFNLLIKLYHAESQNSDLQEQWKNLLNLDQNLALLISEPILSCCSSENDPPLK